jgi:hypothetical protein
MGHIMKFWERVIEHYLTKLTTVFKNKFGFMLWRSTMETIFLIRQFIERYRGKRRIYIWYLLIWRKRMIKFQEISCGGRLKIKKFHQSTLSLYIKDMYINIMINIRAWDGESNVFSTHSYLNHGSGTWIAIFHTLLSKASSLGIFHSFKYLFIASSHVSLGRPLPLLIFSGRLKIPLRTDASGGLRWIWPNHRKRCWTSFSWIGVTPSLSLISSFLIRFQRNISNATSAFQLHSSSGCVVLL